MNSKLLQPDPRHAPIRELIARLYAESNAGLIVPWEGHAAKRLAALLKANARWPLEAWLRAVHHRFDSDVNLAEAPERWIAKLPDYARGPLDEFGKPKRATGGSVEFVPADGRDFEQPDVSGSSDEFLGWVKRNPEKARRAGYPVAEILKEIERRKKILNSEW